MNTNFTQGPWELKKTTARLEVAIPSNPRSSYVFTHIDGANAALIAAAPEMYEMLVYYVGQYGCKCGHPACSRCKDTIETEAILKKARGE